MTTKTTTQLHSETRVEEIKKYPTFNYEILFFVRIWDWNNNS